mmetsp:Transcript_7645/g.18781  ORF Transcript_7645/g.18781 Transcript_7645/m.18781 type:complete len:227 (+) Transcript_7645:558-1238(+)
MLGSVRGPASSRIVTMEVRLRGALLRLQYGDSASEAASVMWGHPHTPRDSCVTHSTVQGSAKPGSTLRGRTVTVNASATEVSCPPLRAPPSSLATTRTTAFPLAYLPAVNLIVPSASNEGASEKSDESVMSATRKLTSCATQGGNDASGTKHSSFAGPTLQFTTKLGRTTVSPAVAVTSRLVVRAKVGASLTGRTSITRSRGGDVSVPLRCVPPSSCRVTVTVTLP